MIILLMGVQGSGKTTVGTMLAKRLGWTMVDADDFHTAENVAKMGAGIPLTDADRAGWLASLRRRIEKAVADGENTVMACSALKEKYRHELVVSEAVKLVYLRGSEELIRTRLEKRTEHYAKPNLLHSQFEQLEEPTDASVVDVNRPVNEVVGAIAYIFGL